MLVRNELLKNCIWTPRCHPNKIELHQGSVAGTFNYFESEFCRENS